MNALIIFVISWLEEHLLLAPLLLVCLIPIHSWPCYQGVCVPLSTFPPLPPPSHPSFPSYTISSSFPFQYKYMDVKESNIMNHGTPYLVLLSLNILPHFLQNFNEINYFLEAFYRTSLVPVLLSLCRGNYYHILVKNRVKILALPFISYITKTYYLNLSVPQFPCL